jgi:hypothetical protein
MRKFLLALAFVATVPAVAEAADVQRITKDGMDIEYQVTALADGQRMITGINNQTGEEFKLKVNRRWVRGRVGPTDVAFRVPRTKPARPSVSVLASN